MNKTNNSYKQESMNWYRDPYQSLTGTILYHIGSCETEKNPSPPQWLYCLIRTGLNRTKCTSTVQYHTVLVRYIVFWTIQDFEPFFMVKPYWFLAGMVRYISSWVVQDGFENLSYKKDYRNSPEPSSLGHTEPYQQRTRWFGHEKWSGFPNHPKFPYHTGMV